MYPKPRRHPKPRSEKQGPTMKQSDIAHWFDKIANDAAEIRKQRSARGVTYYSDQSAQAWVSEAASALAAVFLPAHPIRMTWERLEPDLKPSFRHGGTLEKMIGVFRAAAKMVREGRISGLA